MLSGNLGSLLYGVVSVMLLNINCANRASKIKKSGRLMSVKLTRGVELGKNRILSSTDSRRASCQLLVKEWAPSLN